MFHLLRCTSWWREVHLWFSEGSSDTTACVCLFASLSDCLHTKRWLWKGVCTHQLRSQPVELWVRRTPERKDRHLQSPSLRKCARPPGAHSHIFNSPSWHENSRNVRIALSNRGVIGHRGTLLLIHGIFTGLKIQIVLAAYSFIVVVIVCAALNSIWSQLGIS